MLLLPKADLYGMRNEWLVLGDPIHLKGPIENRQHYKISELALRILQFIYICVILMAVILYCAGPNAK